MSNHKEDKGHRDVPRSRVSHERFRKEYDRIFNRAREREEEARLMEEGAIRESLRKAKGK